jgi:hypothetical protein
MEMEIINVYSFRAVDRSGKYVRGSPARELSAAAF